uniref:Uncharacterized protein n=1 Tax=Arundo donax TaxID=35708 RepID=A0A0A9A4F4_ARUDO
MLTLRIKSQF